MSPSCILSHATRPKASERNERPPRLLQIREHLAGRSSLLLSLGIDVKKQTVILCAALVGGVIAIRLLLWPAVALEWAKRQAIHKLAPESKTFDAVPSESVVRISRHETSSSMLHVDLSGCTISLPSADFKQNDRRRVLFTNDDTLVVFYGAVDPTNYHALEGELG
jgi:hypothetical protein